MFRKMRRFKQELTTEECIELLEKQPRGVLAVHGEDGYPYALPINYIYMNKKLYFHSSKVGHKIDAIQADSRASFCVMDEGYRMDGEWSLTIKSVVVFGRVLKLDDMAKSKDILLALGSKYYPSTEDAEKELRASFGKVQMLEMTIDHITGKIVNEK